MTLSDVEDRKNRPITILNLHHSDILDFRCSVGAVATGSWNTCPPVIYQTMTKQIRPALLPGPPSDVLVTLDLVIKH